MMSDEILTTKHDLTEAVQSAAAGLYAERDSLRAQLEQARKDWEREQQLCQRAEAESFEANKRLAVTELDRDKALRVAEEAARISMIRLESNNALLAEVRKEVAASNGLRETIQFLQSDLLTLRGLVDEMAEALAIGLHLSDDGLNDHSELEWEFIRKGKAAMARHASIKKAHV